MTHYSRHMWLVDLLHTLQGHSVWGRSTHSYVKIVTLEDSL